MEGRKEKEGKEKTIGNTDFCQTSAPSFGSSTNEYVVTFHFYFVFFYVSYFAHFCIFNFQIVTFLFM